MIRLSDVPAKEMFPGFFGKFFHGESSTLAIWEIKKGSILPEHHHVQEQIVCVLEGELDMTIGGQKFLLTGGSVHVILSNVPHSGIARQDSKVIDTFTPVREDYK